MVSSKFLTDITLMMAKLHSISSKNGTLVTHFCHVMLILLLFSYLAGLFATWEVDEKIYNF